MKLEVSDRGRIWIIAQRLAYGIEENHENLIQD
jgi:hypothetical protein